MKIIIDECLPKRLTKIFSDHDAWTVPQVGLAGYKDSELDELIDALPKIKASQVVHIPL